MGKGSRRRPRQVSKEEEELRGWFYQGKIEQPEFDRKLREIRKRTKKP